MRIPEAGPFGETFFEAKVRAIVLASLVNNPAGGWVESVLTLATHRFFATIWQLLSRMDANWEAIVHTDISDPRLGAIL
jgi:hypothetical protein